MLCVQVLVGADALGDLLAHTESLCEIGAYFLHDCGMLGYGLPLELDVGVALVVEGDIVDFLLPIPHHHQVVLAAIQHTVAVQDLLLLVGSADPPIAVDVLHDHHQAHPRILVPIVPVVLVILLGDRDTAGCACLHFELPERNRILLLLDDAAD